MYEDVLPIGWQEVELGQLGSLFRGSGGTRDDEDPYGIPCIRYGDLYTHHDCVIRSFASSISAASVSSYTPLRQGDVVFAGSGETFDEIGKGAVYCSDEPAYAGADTIIFRSKGETYPQFLGYAVNSVNSKNYKSRMGQGSSVIHIGIEHLSRMRVQLPPIEEQKRIANILLMIDETIGQTEFLIAKTQWVKFSLMQEFFNTPVPLVCLYSIVSPVNKKAAGFKDPNKPYVGLEHLPSGGSLLLGTSNPEEYTSTCSVFEKDDVLFGKLRPRLRKSIRAPFDGYCSTDILVLRAIGEDSRFVGYLLQSDPVFAEAIRTEEGTRMPRCSWSTLRNLEVYCPEPAQQEHIADILKTVDETIEENEALLAKLQQVKAGLMQDLLTGRVRVPAAPSPSDTAEAPADV